MVAVALFLLLLPLGSAVPGAVSQNLTLWLDASNASSLFQSSCGGTAASDGDTVGCWEDASGNNYDFIASGTERPLLRTGTGAINYNPTIDFDGSNDFLEDANGENYINGIDEFTTFVIVDSTTAAADRYIFNSENQASNAESPWGLRFDNAGALSGKDDTLKTGINTGTPELYEGNQSNIASASPMLASIEWASGEAPGMHVNAQSIPIHPATTKSGSLTGADYTRIGHEGGHDFWSGTIAELVHYDVKLNSSARQRIASHLAIKYGVTLHNGTDYVDAAGSVVFASTGTHENYTTNIAGIGRDDTSALNQTRSRSSNSDSIVDMSNATSLGDGDFLIWAMMVEHSPQQQMTLQSAWSYYSGHGAQIRLAMLAQ